jgi:hypothetical protein
MSESCWYRNHGDEGMPSLAEVGQLLLDVASGGVQEGDSFIRYQWMLEYFSAVADVVDNRQKDPKRTHLGDVCRFHVLSS